MKLKIALLLVFTAAVFGQLYIAPTGSRVLTSAPPTLILQYGIYFEPDAAVGQAAFDECMKTGTEFVCEPVRAAKIREDGERRLHALVYEEFTSGQSAMETRLAQRRLYLVRP